MSDVPQARSGLFISWVLLALITAVFLGAHQLYVATVHPSALYMDSLRILAHLDDWEQGRSSLLQLWGYGSGSHRGLLFELFLLANVKWFSLDVLMANRLTGVAILLVGLLLSGSYLRNNLSNQEFSGAWKKVLLLYFAVTIVALGFSPAGFELLTLDLGFPLWIKNLCFIAYFVAQDRLLQRPSPSLSVALSFVGPVIVLVVAMGWSYAFVGAVCLTHLFALFLRRQHARSLLAALPVATILIAGLAYVSGGSDTGDGISAALLLQKLSAVLWLTCHAIGAVFIGVEAAARFGVPQWICGALGAGLIAMASLFVVAALRRRHWAGSLLPFQLMAYGGLVAFSVSYARGDAGADAVMASRYYMDVYLFTIGLLWVWSEAVLAIRARIYLILPLILLQGLLWCGQLITQWTEWHSAPFRRDAIAAMNRVTLNGIIGAEEASLLQSPLRDAKAGVSVMRRSGLGVFRGSTSGVDCLDTAIGLSKGWYAIENGSVWMSRSAALNVPPCRCSATAEIYLPDAFRAREITVSTEGREVTRLQLLPGRSSRLELPATDEQAVFDIVSSIVTVPAIELGGEDGRELSVLWSIPSFECESTAPTGR